MFDSASVHNLLLVKMNGKGNMYNQFIHCVHKMFSPTPRCPENSKIIRKQDHKNILYLHVV